MDGVKRLPCRENGPRSCSFLATIIKELSCISPGRENETARANRERERETGKDREIGKSDCHTRPRIKNMK
jgi:hypothetical protein